MKTLILKCLFRSKTEQQKYTLVATSLNINNLYIPYSCLQSNFYHPYLKECKREKYRTSLHIVGR